MAGILEGIGNWLTTPNTPKQRAFFDALTAAGARGLQSAGARYALPRSSSQNYGDMLAAYQGSMQGSRKSNVELEKAAQQRKLFEQQQEAYKRQQQAIGTDPELQKAFDMGGPSAVNKLLEYRRKQKRQNQMMRMLRPGASTAPAASTGTHGVPSIGAPSQQPQPQLPAPPGYPSTPAQVAPQAAPAAPQAGLSEVPPAIRDIVPQDQLALAMMSDKPGEAINKLARQYMPPQYVPEKREERFTYWRKRVEPYKARVDENSRLLSLVEHSLKLGTGAGDITAIQGFQRMIDPGAVVRGEDVKLIASATGLVQGWFARLEKAKSGALYDPTLRSDIAEAAVTFANKVRENALLRMGEESELADPYVTRRWNRRIIGDSFVKRLQKPFTVSGKYPHRSGRNTTRATPAPAPKIGSVHNGYRYNGGDPNLPTSWSKI